MEFGPKVIFELPFLGGIPITETVVNTWIIMIVLTVFAIISGKGFKKVPRGKQNVVEVIVDAMNNLTVQTMGKDKKAFASYMGSLFFLLLFANLFGLLGLRPPTADMNTTFALAILTFILIHGSGVKRKGLGTYLKGFLEPFPLLLPMNIIGELATPISLSFRLFGNIIGGVIIMSLLYGGLIGFSSMVGLGVFPIFQAGIPVVFHLYFDVFAGVLQTFIFMMLSMVFISIAMD
ncbi:F0F1 ATP synthase subunit A [Clostridium formicaceticum]|uniref:ATP synthase subunit a n=1 Tax=Clostridium formicaceticum TaxID=1497 RepID=A0AAC9RHG5_9CLOT|nr:F0F1 ATP synthase subunit A [Clostridium formicaceticum]AOY75578.1 ATP synthase F0 subunit A [Clostridium formicaceticum]ARE85882.1 ATP synthase subunit a [Clostridium formicaceticum]